MSRFLARLFRIRSRATCARKVRYGHMETAIKATEEMAAKDVHGLTAYECPFCRGFHIGHDPNASIEIAFGKIATPAPGAKEEHG